MRIDNTDAVMQEELREARNPIEKQIILQKYGLIDTKLTEEEKSWITLDEAIIAINGTSEIFF